MARRGWTARVDDGRLVTVGTGPAEPDAWWTAVAAAGWDHLDAHRRRRPTRAA